MKRFLTIILAGVMILSLVSCGEKEDEKEEENVIKLGLLQANYFDITSEHQKHVNPAASTDFKIESILYSNLSSALMDLESGKLNEIGLEKCTADYVAAHNENIMAQDIDENCTEANFSMMTMEENREVYDILNNAIKEMKADGTLDSLVENELKAYIESDPAAKDLPEFEDAITITVGVTGDMPPMDYVAANGKAAGFNIALLTEIANRTQVNFELVQIETGARAIALSSDKVDAVFWIKDIRCDVCGATASEVIDRTLVTESYFSDYSASVRLKSEK